MIERATRNSDNTMRFLALHWRSDDNADKNEDWRSNALQLLVAIDIRCFDRLAWPGLAREGEARMKRVLIALATGLLSVQALAADSMRAPPPAPVTYDQLLALTSMRLVGGYRGRLVSRRDLQVTEKTRINWLRFAPFALSATADCSVISF